MEFELREGSSSPERELSRYGRPVGLGLDASQGVLFVVDGGSAIGSAIRAFFDPGVAVHRCHRHKERNVLEHLPEIERPLAQRRLRAAWAEPDPDRAKTALLPLARSHPHSRPGAAASL